MAIKNNKIRGFYAAMDLRYKQTKKGYIGQRAYFSLKKKIRNIVIYMVFFQTKFMDDFIMFCSRFSLVQLLLPCIQYVHQSNHKSGFAFFQSPARVVFSLISC